MIKITKGHNCTFYWKNSELYDKNRKKDVRIKFCGLTIYHNTDSYDCDLLDEKDKKTGFIK